jgi:hypothetical protein
VVVFSFFFCCLLLILVKEKSKKGRWEFYSTASFRRKNWAFLLSCERTRRRTRTRGRRRTTTGRGRTRHSFCPVRELGRRRRRRRRKVAWIFVLLWRRTLDVTMVMWWWWWWWWWCNVGVELFFGFVFWKLSLTDLHVKPLVSKLPSCSALARTQDP